jgi:hypothetical protein
LFVGAFNSANGIVATEFFTHCLGLSCGLGGEMFYKSTSPSSDGSSDCIINKLMGTNIHDSKIFYGAKRRLSKTLVDNIKEGSQLLSFNL